MQLKAGLRLKSVACSTTVIVVRAPADDVDLRCGGYPMVPAGEDGASRDIDPHFASGTAMGKRYEHGGLEMLCTKPGDGTVSIGDQPVAIKSAKSMPASD